MEMPAMRILKSAALVAALVAFSAGAHAQILSIGSTAGGAVNQIATTLSKLVSQNTSLQMRSQTLGGTQQYIPMVDAGEISFGLSNLPQYWMAKTGTGLSKKKYDNMMLAANMMTFTVAPLVADQSPIRKPSDFKGKRVPFGFKAVPLFSYIASGMLANGNLGYKDVKRIPVVGLPQHWDLLKQGKIDFAVAAIGTGAINEMNLAIKGGVRFVSMDNSPEALERLTKVYPKSFLKQVQPAPTLAGV